MESFRFSLLELHKLVTTPHTPNIEIKTTRCVSPSTGVTHAHDVGVPPKTHHMACSFVSLFTKNSVSTQVLPTDAVVRLSISSHPNAADYKSRYIGLHIKYRVSKVSRILTYFKL